MANILIVYSSHDGQTEKICQFMRQQLDSADQEVSIVSVEQTTGVDLRQFDKIVVGASIRYGSHSPTLISFIRENRVVLDSKPNAFFSVNLVARKPEKNRPETNPYVQKFLKRICWQPKTLAVFAGKIDYPSCTHLDRLMIQLIMWLTNGPTDPKAVIEFTDWNQVSDFARRIENM